MELVETLRSALLNSSYLDSGFVLLRNKRSRFQRLLPYQRLHCILCTNALTLFDLYSSSNISKIGAPTEPTELSLKLWVIWHWWAIFTRLIQVVALIEATSSTELEYFDLAWDGTHCTWDLLGHCFGLLILLLTIVAAAIISVDLWAIVERTWI